VSIPRPGAGECSDYLIGYSSRVPDGPILETLAVQIQETAELLEGAGEGRGDHRYAPGKWTVKEVIGHLADSELVFTYRALRFARGDSTPLPGFEQDDWVPRAGCGERTLAEMEELLRRARALSLALFSSFPDEAWGRRGVAAGAEIVVSAFPWIIAGHELHHVAVLRERYGLARRGAGGP
jgi:hypothetical protein